MRDFSWQYFMMTGDVDAYLLYKATNGESLANEEGRVAKESWMMEAGSETEVTNGDHMI